MLVRAGGYPKFKKNAGGSLGGRRCTVKKKNSWRGVALVERNALQMLTWRSFVVVVVVVVVVGRRRRRGRRGCCCCCCCRCRCR